MLRGATPYLATTPASSKISPRRRSQHTTRSPATNCAKSLSGEQITIRSTAAISPNCAAAAAIASSASNFTIGHTHTPNAAAARSASPNCASKSGGVPSPVLYPGNNSLRKEVITLSKAQPICVTSFSRSKRNKLCTSPYTAPTARPSGERNAGNAW